MNAGRRHQHRGWQTEAAVVCDLLDRGISVSVPLFSEERYDLVIDWQGTLQRAQVRTAYDHHERDGTVVVEFDTTVYDSDGTPRRTYYEAEELDAYLVRYPAVEATLSVPFDAAPKTQMNFSLRDPADCDEANRKTIHFFEEYTLDAG